ncbi:hypothetical protein KA344_13340 [bacterium]|nr:hypothetical protein [bacterium]
MASNQLAQDSKRALSKALDFLRLHQDTVGWFPYKESGQPSMEATAWSALALRQDLSVSRAAALFLARNQNKDGGWSTEPGAGRSDWNSGPAMLCLRLLAAEHEEIGKNKDVKKAIKLGFARLLDSRIEFYQPIARLLLLMSQGPKSLAYGRGWPWDPDCFHWVEPTAYNLLALKYPTLPNDELYSRIVTFANQFLLEHSCRDGGWNHGNNITLEQYLPPYRLTTAEALLALQDRPDHASVQSSLKYLKSLSQQNTSSVSLAVSALALLAYQQPAKQEIKYLIARQGADGSFTTSIITTALAALALQADEDRSMHVLTNPQTSSEKG